MATKRKSEAYKHISVQAAGTQDPPEWNDVLRGILIALVEQRRAMWDARFRPTKERCIQLCIEIASVLSNQDKRMNEWAVLEKWCWMMEMYVRASEMEGSSWRYKSAMSFILGFAGNGGHYLACVPQKRFLELTTLYANQEEELVIAAQPLPNRCVKIAAAWFLNELMDYAAMLSGKGVKEKPEPSTSQVATQNEAQIMMAQSKDFEEALKSFLHKPPAPTVAPRRGRPPRAAANARNSVVTRNSPRPATPNETSFPPTSTPSSSYAPVVEVISVVDSEKLPGGSVKEEQRDATDDGVTSSTVWTPKLTSCLIAEVKTRPVLWNAKHPQFNDQQVRKDGFAEVVSILHQQPGGEQITLLDVMQKWASLLRQFGAATLNGQNDQKPLELCRQMEFLQYNDLGMVSPSQKVMSMGKKEADTSLLIDPSIFMNGQNGEDVLAHVRALMGISMQTEEPAAKRLRQTPSTASQQASPPQITATWIPPKEDFLSRSVPPFSIPLVVSAAPGTVATVAPTATAQIMTTSNGSLSTLLESVKPARRRQNQANLIAEQLLRSAERKDTPSTPTVRTEDKWNLLGRLIEETCRELDEKNPALAVLLQKELSDVICNYQMKNLNIPNT